MFQLIMRSGYEMKIEGCPSYGLEAIDFRRQHNLPEEPSSKIKPPSGAFQDEKLVRQLRAAGAYIDMSGDWVFDGQSIIELHGRGNGAHSKHGPWHYGSALPVEPAAIKAYIENPCADTLFGVAMAICQHNAEQMKIIEAEQRTVEEAARSKEAARLCLKDEIDKLESKINYLQSELQESKERIAELEDELEAQKVS